MQTNTLSTKVIDKLGDAASTLVVAMGTVTLIWIVAFIITSLLK